MARKEGDLVEILHTTDHWIASFAEYNQKYEHVRVSTTRSQKSHLVWAWKEDDKHLPNHPSNKIISGTNWVLYSTKTAEELEREYQNHTARVNGDGIFDIDLSGAVHKFRQGQTGLQYQINLKRMVQTNKKSGYERSICRQVHFSEDFQGVTKELPKPFDNWQMYSFLPTRSGQIFRITKTWANGQWCFGKVTFRKGPLPVTEGWFPAVFCRLHSLSLPLAGFTVGSNQVPTVRLPQQRISSNYCTRPPPRAMTREVVRTAWASVDIDPPKTWEIGQNGLLEVSSCSQEYNDAILFFYKTLDANRCEVVKVERIQAIDMWRMYAVKNHSIQRRYKDSPSTLSNNTLDGMEKKWLFHGTSASAVSNIVKQGFNRSFAGSNGTYFGKGVYFATNSHYASKFAPYDAHGLKRMFLCRVAVGDYCQGRNDQMTPDQKPGVGSGLFDSTVDRISYPSIFVVYHDGQVYPEYLITFK